MQLLMKLQDVFEKDAEGITPCGSRALFAFVAFAFRLIPHLNPLWVAVELGDDARKRFLRMFEAGHIERAFKLDRRETAETARRVAHH